MPSTTRVPGTLFASVACTVLALLAVAPVITAEPGGDPVDVTGRVTSTFAHRTAAPEGLSQREHLVDLEISHEWGEGWRIRGLGRLRIEDRLEPTSRTELRLRELVLSRRTRDTQLELGRQQVIWGKADGFRLLDVVNPLDQREFLFEDFTDSRIPLWMVNAEVFRGDQAFQLLIIPDLAFDRVPAPGAEFFPLPELLDSPVPLTVRDLEEPASSDPGNWELGVRWSGLVGRLDLSVNALYGWNNSPTPSRRLTPAGLEITPRPQRSRLLGASGDLPVGPAILRFEATYTRDDPREVATANGLGSFDRQQVWRHVLGLDWIRNNWLISPQWFEERVIDPDPDLSEDRQRTFLSLLVRRAFRQDRLTFQTFYAYDFAHGDEWLSPELSYRFFGRLELTLGADLLDGDPRGVFGRFDGRDRITFETTVRF